MAARQLLRRPGPLAEVRHNLPRGYHGELPDSRTVRSRVTPGSTRPGDRPHLPLRGAPRRREHRRASPRRFRKWHRSPSASSGHCRHAPAGRWWRTCGGCARHRPASRAARPGRRLGAPSPPMPTPPAGELVDAFQGFIADHPALTAELVVAICCTQLRKPEASATAMTWLDCWLDDEGHGAEESAAANPAACPHPGDRSANSITSLRTLGAHGLARVRRGAEPARGGASPRPGGDLFPAWTFETRDQLPARGRAARSQDRRDPSEQVGTTARDSPGTRRKTRRPRSSHVGFFLLGAGRATLEQSVGYRTPLGERWRRAAAALPRLALGRLAPARHRCRARGTPLALAGPSPVRRRGPASPAGADARPTRSRSASSSCSHQLPPTAAAAQARLSRSGVPAESRTAGGGAAAARQRRAVRPGCSSIWRCSSSPTADANLHFALLTDFTDAPTEELPGDAALSSQAPWPDRPRSTRATRRTGTTFLPVSTARGCWNAQQGVLDGLGAEARQARGVQPPAARARRHQLLGHASATSPGCRERPLRASRSTPTPSSRATPRGAWSARSPTRSTARSSIRPAGGSCAGYGILQPRVGITLPSAGRSLFARIFSGNPGIDPYTTAVSDVYQDLFGEGTLHRQGHLRRRRLRARRATGGSREHAAQPRPDRGQLRPRRAGDRHRAVRRLSRRAT